MSSDKTANSWKRRERALGAGAVLWSLGVAAIASLRPDAAAHWLSTTPTLAVAGTLMTSIGLLGGFCEGVLLAADRWASSHVDEDLTEVPWNE